LVITANSNKFGFGRVIRVNAFYRHSPQKVKRLNQKDSAMKADRYQFTYSAQAHARPGLSGNDPCDANPDPVLNSKAMMPYPV
jgi:hypothetical protein